MFDRMGVFVIRMGGMHRAGATDRTTELRPTQRIVNDLTNRACAAPALGAAAQAAIDLRGGAGRRFFGGVAHFAVGQDVAGTDDHGPTRDVGIIWPIADRESKQNQ